MREKVKILIYSHLSGRQKCKVLQGVILPDFEHNSSIFDNRTNRAMTLYVMKIQYIAKKHIDTIISQIRLYYNKNFTIKINISLIELTLIPRTVYLSCRDIL